MAMPKVQFSTISYFKMDKIGEGIPHPFYTLRIEIKCNIYDWLRLIFAKRNFQYQPLIKKD